MKLTIWIRYLFFSLHALIVPNVCHTEKSSYTFTLGSLRQCLARGGGLTILFFVNTGTSFLRFLSVFCLGKCTAAYNYLGTLGVFTMVIKINNFWNVNEQSSMPFSEQMDLCSTYSMCSF